MSSFANVRRTSVQADPLQESQRQRGNHASNGSADVLEESGLPTLLGLDVNAQAELHLQSLCEMFPMLRREEITNILQKQRFQLLPSIDACIVLAEKVTHQNQELRLSSSAFEQSASRSSGSHVSKPPMIKVSGAQDGDEETNGDISKDGVTSRARAGSVPKVGPYRGTRVVLPELFLSPPSSRFIAEHVDDEFQNFSVVFYRVRGKLGMQVQKVQSFIVVRALSAPLESPTNAPKPPRISGGPADKPNDEMGGPVQRGLAERAGVRIGDILTGYDGGLFTPGVHVEDIIWQLAKPRDVLTLHFKRPLVPDFWSAEKRLHPLATVLLHQKAIDMPQAENLTEHIAAVNERIRQWRSGFITKRIRSVSRSFDGAELDATDVKASPDVCIATRSLRPALSVRILGTAEEDERTVYIISVVDVESDYRWVIRRRFRAFYELKENLIAERPDIAQLPFPHRRLSNTASIVNYRQQVLEHFLRELLTMPVLQPLHPSASRVHARVQEFLGVSNVNPILEAHQAAMGLHAVCRQAMQVHIHAILGIPHLQNVVSQFFRRCGRQACDAKWAGTGTALVKLVAQFLDSLHIILLDTLTLELQAVAREHGLDSHDDIVEQIMSTAVRRQVETEVYLPLEEAIFRALQSEIEPEHRMCVARIGEMRSTPQSAFDICTEHISLSSWQSAIERMIEVKEKHIPYDKLQCLAEACKEVPRLYILEHPSSSGPLAADDFLPIFIYVLVNADIDNLLELKHILPEMCEPSQRLSEMGYYVATFAAAVEHLVEKLMDQADAPPVAF